jgi:hypothetical protein
MGSSLIRQASIRYSSIQVGYLEWGGEDGQNMAFRIKIEIVETEMEATSDRCPQEEADGVFSVVLPEADAPATIGSGLC